MNQFGYSDPGVSSLRSPRKSAGSPEEVAGVPNRGVSSRPWASGLWGRRGPAVLTGFALAPLGLSGSCLGKGGPRAGRKDPARPLHSPQAACGIEEDLGVHSFPGHVSVAVTVAGEWDDDTVGQDWQGIGNELLLQLVGGRQVPEQPWQGLAHAGLSRTLGPRGHPARARQGAYGNAACQSALDCQIYCLVVSGAHFPGSQPDCRFSGGREHLELSTEVKITPMDGDQKTGTDQWFSI